MSHSCRVRALWWSLVRSEKVGGRLNPTEIAPFHKNTMNRFDTWRNPFFPSLCFDWWPRDFRNGEEIQPTSSELQTKTTRPVHPAAGLRPHVGTRAPPRMCAWTQWFQRWIWDENIPTGDDDHPNDYSFYLFRC
jgi:hypothetical protein